FVLEGHDLVELLLDVVEDGGEVVAVELLAALLAELLEEIAEAFQALAERVAHAALKEVAEGVLEVAEVQEVIGQAGEDVVGVERRDILSAVPFGVAEAVSHAGAIIRDARGVRSQEQGDGSEVRSTRYEVRGRKRSEVG